MRTYADLEKLAGIKEVEAKRKRRYVRAEFVRVSKMESPAVDPFKKNPVILQRLWERRMQQRIDEREEMW